MSREFSAVTFLLAKTAMALAAAAPAPAPWAIRDISVAGPLFPPRRARRAPAWKRDTPARRAARAAKHHRRMIRAKSR